MKQYRISILIITLIVLSTVQATEKYEPIFANVPREKALYLVGFQWGDPLSFNPMNGWPAWPIRPEFNLMYEQLTSYNSLTNTVEPLLGRLEEVTNDYVKVILNPKAKWSDGTPLTAEDVLFSYNLNLTECDAPLSYIRDDIKEVLVDTVTTGAVSEERITLIVKKEDQNNPLSVVDITSSVCIYPKHIWGPKLKKASLYQVNEDMMDYQHVISGPYNLHDYSNEKIVLKRRDDYWGNEALHGGKMAQPEYIIHPIYRSNQASLEALRNGDIDISSNYIPSVWKERKITTWFDEAPYYRSGSIPLFIPNTTKAPLNNRHFRRAMAFAIDYNTLSQEAVFGYSEKIQSGLILPTTAESTYFSQEEVNAHGATVFDPKRAAEELQRAGIIPHYQDTAISKSGDTTYGALLCNTNLSGDTLPTLKIMSPKGWADFEMIVNIAVKSMRMCGIDVESGFVDASVYWPAKSKGAFDIYMDTPATRLSQSMPYTRFEIVLSSSNWKPLGEHMYVNIGRFNRPNSPEYIPAIDSLLAVIPLLSDESEKQKAYTRLNRLFMEEQPVIPLLYRPEEFYSFNSKYWTNFPTSEATEKTDGPYLPPHTPGAGAATKMLWKIRSTQKL